MILRRVANLTLIYLIVTFTILSLGAGAGADTAIGWNIWAQKAKDVAFEPIPNLEPDTANYITIELASHPSGTPEAGVTWVADWGLTRSLIRDPIPLVSPAGERSNSVAILFDVEERARAIEQPFALDSKTLRSWSRSETRNTSALQEPDAQRLSFGRVRFPVKTRAREGPSRFRLDIDLPGGLYVSIEVAVCIAANQNAVERLCGRSIEARIISEEDQPRTTDFILPGETSDPRPPAVLWNAWAEESLGPGSRLAFTPVQHMKPETTYLVALELSSLSFGKNEDGVLTKVSERGFQTSLADWLKGSESEVKLKVLVLPDPAHFKSPTQPTETLSINLDKLRKLQKDDLGTVLDNPFALLAQNSDQPFSFGRVVFRVATRSHQVKASIAFSIWVDDGITARPLDEIAVTFCISTPANTAFRCKGVRESPFGFKGIDSLRVANEKAPFPDAALHFVQLGADRPVIAVFHQNDRPGSYTVWNLQRTAKELHDFLRNTQFDVFKNAVSDEDLLRHGQDLFNTLFPSSEQDGKEARSAFEKFVQAHFSKTPFSRDMPSIFIRLVNQGELIPLGLMAVPLRDQPADFIGFHFRIETPLLSQTYQTSSSCLSEWAMVFPSENIEDQSLKTARVHAATLIQDKWIKEARRYDKTMSQFGDWLRTEEEEDTISIVIVLSHHSKNQLSFSTRDVVTSSSVVRMFKKPAIAILNGCGTAQPGAEDFIKELNRRGMSTVIATSTEVDAEMAGDFLNCVDSILTEHEGEPNYNVSQAYTDALRCLRDKAPTKPGALKYGARALKYALLGNGNLRLCSPKRATNP